MHASIKIKEYLIWPPQWKRTVYIIVLKSTVNFGFSCILISHYAEVRGQFQSTRQHQMNQQIPLSFHVHVLTFCLSPDK